MNTKLQAILITLLLVGQIITQSTVNDAGALLDSLENDAKTSLKELEEAWTKKSATLASVLGAFTTAYETQRDECSFWEGNLDLLDTTLEKLEKNMDFISARIRKNELEAHRRKEQQCENQRLYINGLKNNKILLKFIEFLRAAVKKAQKDGTFAGQSFAQRNMFITSLFNFLQVVKSKDYRAITMMQTNMQKNLAFLELDMVNHPEHLDRFTILTDLTKEVDGFEVEGSTNQDLVNDGEFQVETNMDVTGRTSSEIGSGHEDNDRKKIDLDQFKSGKREGAGLYLKDILVLLDGIEEETKVAMKEGQKAQIEAGLSFVDYLVATEKERGQLDEYLFDQSELYGKTSKVVKPTETKVDLCHVDLIEDKKAVDRTLGQIKNEENVFQHKKVSIQEELEIIIAVNRIYNDKVEGQGGDFESRIDDHVEDGEFNDGEGADRGIDNVEFDGEDTVDEDQFAKDKAAGKFDKAAGTNTTTEAKPQAATNTTTEAKSQAATMTTTEAKPESLIKQNQQQQEQKVEKKHHNHHHRKQ